MRSDLKGRDVVVLSELLESHAGERMPYRQARKLWKAFLERRGYKSVVALLVEDGNLKTSLDGTVETVTLTLTSWGVDLSDGRFCLTCPAATDGCIDACVLKGGNALIYDEVPYGRDTRTMFAAEHPVAFLTILERELWNAAKRSHSRLRVRLNTASDLKWERIIPEVMRDVHDFCTRNVRRYREASPTFYDYTKLPPVTRDDLGGAYRVCFSVSERKGTLQAGAFHIMQGGTAAVVLDVDKGDDVPATLLGLPTIDGDVSDDRAADPAGHWVVLRAKGVAVGDDHGGFVKSAAALEADTLAA